MELTVRYSGPAVTLPRGEMNQLLILCNYCDAPAKAAPFHHFQTNEPMVGFEATCGKIECETHAVNDFELGKAQAKGEL